MKTKRQPLTEKEERFWYKYIDYYLDRLKEPTRTELARYFKASPQVVQYYLSILRTKGYLK